MNNCYIEIRITVDGDVYRYSGSDINRTIKNAKRTYMSKTVVYPDGFDQAHIGHPVYTGEFVRHTGSASGLRHRSRRNGSEHVGVHKSCNADA